MTRCGLAALAAYVRSAAAAGETSMNDRLLFLVFIVGIVVGFLIALALEVHERDQALRADYDRRRARVFRHHSGEEEE
jgi:hypothetical protein